MHMSYSPIISGILYIACLPTITPHDVLWLKECKENNITHITTQFSQVTMKYHFIIYIYIYIKGLQSNAKVMVKANLLGEVNSKYQRKLQHQTSADRLVPFYGKRSLREGPLK